MVTTFTALLSCRCCCRLAQANQAPANCQVAGLLLPCHQLPDALQQPTSSTKMMLGAFCLASRNTSRTMRGPCAEQEETANAQHAAAAGKRAMRGAWWYGNAAEAQT